MHSQTSSVFGPAVAKSQLMVKSDEGCCVSGWLGRRLINLQIDKEEKVCVYVRKRGSRKERVHKNRDR